MIRGIISLVSPSYISANGAGSPHKNIRELGIMAFCYGLILAPPFLAELWKNYSGVYYLFDRRSNYIINTSLILTLVALSLACLTQYTGRFQRFVFLIITFVLSCLGMIALIHVALYDAPISVGAVDALLGTDLHEAVEYLGFNWTLTFAMAVGLYVLLFALITGLILPRLRSGAPCLKSHAVAWCVLLLLGMLAYQFPAVAAHNQEILSQRNLWNRAAELNHQLPSIRILYDMGEWWEYRQWLEETQTVRSSQTFKAVLGDGPKPRTVVLVIGESLRRDRMSLYGYSRPTTPHLDKRRKQLLVFESAISPSNQTVPSLTKMLTPATVQQPDLFLTEPSIIAAAKNAGYHTYWLSNQGRVGNFDSMISLIAHDADTTVYTNTEFYGSIFDSALLHPLEVALRDPYPHKFIVLHLLGSHQSYRNRYPPEKNFFHPDSYRQNAFNEEQATIESEYDNSARYTDEVLEGFLLQLEKLPNSIMLFVSDHAERLYEPGEDYCGHAFPDPMQIEFDVPYFLWCNGACPQRWQGAYTKYHATAFSTENLYHTLANLLGLQMTSYRPEDDILNRKFKPVALPQIIDVNRGLHTYVSLPKAANKI